MKHLLIVVICAFVGCSSGSSYTPKLRPSADIDYNSDAFKNADPKVQEDILIYDVLRQQGFSDQESKRAVINSQ